MNQEARYNHKILTSCVSSDWDDMPWEIVSSIKIHWYRWLWYLLNCQISNIILVCLFDCLFVFWLCLVACRILVPQPGIEPRPSAVKAQSPNHWTAREFPSFYFFFLNVFYLFLFLAVLGLHCCRRAFSSCDGRRLLFVAVRGLLIVVASLVAEHGL